MCLCIQQMKMEFQEWGGEGVGVGKEWWEGGSGGGFKENHGENDSSKCDIYLLYKILQRFY